MGIGDELMAAGEAQRRAAGSSRKFQILDKKGRPKWHEVWAGNPNIAAPGEQHDAVFEAYSNRRRPYLLDATARRYIFTHYEPVPAFIRLDRRAQEAAKRTSGAVVFNPTIKQRASPNKQWPVASWKALVAQGIGRRWVQIGEPSGQPRLRGAEAMPTYSFMEACGAIAGAAAVVVHEGALHHVAAALGVPAVVIRGGYISPRVTGYAGQVDLYLESTQYTLGCGMRAHCSHCQEAMSKITPGMVLEALQKALEGRRP